ncbi:hypothetical protein NOR_01632 [Metarhizium rileyi]|uniref:Uncharacterized protein n=1 Tax=Metarhizium rileyi (strain RCEF 4871) TaxID=1649241 RepID=A0A167HVR4_METRR|nr:hypothetical protein NOR_01632 [Metarhizium rileyi RCEF 4871]
MDGRDVTCASPTASVSSPLSKFGTLGAQQVTSPYLSESAHVFSLQHPVGKVLEDGSGEDAKVSRNSDATEVDVQRNENSPDPILDVLSAETASRPPSIRSRMSRKSRRSRRGDNFEPQDELRDSIDSECIPTKHNIIHDKDHELDNSSRSYVRLSWISTWSHNLGKTGAWLKEELAHSKLSHKIFSRDHAHRRHSRPSLCAISSSSRRSSIKNTHKDGARIFLGTNIFVPQIFNSLEE